MGVEVEAETGAGARVEMETGAMWNRKC